MKLGRPVKWTETRSENYRRPPTAATTSRKSSCAARRTARSRRLRGTRLGRHGRVPLDRRARHPDHPARADAVAAPTPSPNVKEDVYGVYTNTTPVEAYRGAGRPEATFLLERLIDRSRTRSAMDPVEVRRRTSSRSSTTATTSATGLTYDSGNYHGRARQGARARRLRPSSAPEQARPARKGRYLGIGVCDLRRDLRPRARRRWPARSASRAACGRARSCASTRPARCNVFIGAKPHGQGEETTFAQIVARRARRAVDDVKVDARRHRHDADGLGHLRQPHHRGRRRRAGAGARKIKDKAQALSPRTCSRPRSRTWTTPTASSS